MRRNVPANETAYCYTNPYHGRITRHPYNVIECAHEVSIFVITHSKTEPAGEASFDWNGVGRVLLSLQYVLRLPNGEAAYKKQRTSKDGNEAA